MPSTPPVPSGVTGTTVLGKATGPHEGSSSKLTHPHPSTPTVGQGETPNWSQSLRLTSYSFQYYHPTITHTTALRSFMNCEYQLAKAWSKPREPACQVDSNNNPYSRVPIRRGVRNIRHGAPLASCIVPNKRHGYLGLNNRCKFMYTTLCLKVPQFDILILL